MTDKQQYAGKSDEDVIRHAISRNPGCAFGVVKNGMDHAFRMTRVVELYRNEDCWLAGDPPRATEESYPW